MTCCDECNCIGIWLVPVTSCKSDVIIDVKIISG